MHGKRIIGSVDKIRYMIEFKVGDLFVSRTSNDIAEIISITTENVIYKWHRRNYAYNMRRVPFNIAISDGSYEILSFESEKDKLAYLIKNV